MTYAKMLLRKCRQCGGQATVSRELVRSRCCRAEYGPVRLGQDRETRDEDRSVVLPSPRHPKAVPEPAFTDEEAMTGTFTRISR